MSTVGVSARVLTSARGHKIARVREHHRWTRRVASVLLILMSTLGVGVGAASAANAWSISDALDNLFCAPATVFNSMQPVNNGMSAMGVGLTAVADDGFNNNRHTAYDRYGTAGLMWTVASGTESKDSIGKDDSRVKVTDEDTDWRTSTDPCQQYLPIITTAIANVISMFTTIVVGVGGWIFQQAYDTAWLDGLTQTVINIVSGDGKTAGLYQSLYLPFLNVLITVGAAGLIFTKLMLHKHMELMQHLGWMLVVVSLGNFMLMRPDLAITGVNNAVNYVSQAPLAAMGNATSGNGSELCYVPATALSVTGSGGALAGEGTHYTASMMTPQQVTSAANCAFWEVYLYQPWKMAQWGSDADNLPSPLGLISAPDVDLGGGYVIKGNWALAQLDAQVKDPQELAEDGSEVLKTNTGNWNTIMDAMGSPDGFNDESRWKQWSGLDGGWGRIGIAFLALVAAIAGMIATAYLSIQMLMQSFWLLFLVAVSPLVFLVAVMPQMRRTFFSWLEQVVGTGIRRTVACILIAIITMINNGLMLGDAAWGIKALGVIIASITVIKFRPVLENMIISKVNLGGDGQDFGRQKMQADGENASKRGVAATAGAMLAGGAALAGIGGVTKAVGAAGGGRVRKLQKATSTVAKAAGRGAARGGAAGKMSGYAAINTMNAGSEQVRKDSASVNRSASQQRAAEKDQSATAVAKRNREDAQRASQYERDYAANRDDAAWVNAIREQYGFEPPNPETHRFTGYGLRKQDLRSDQRPQRKPEDKDSEQSAAPKAEEKRDEGMPRPKQPRRNSGMPRPKKPGSGEQGMPRPGGK